MKQQKYITNLLEKNKNNIIIGSLGTISYDMGERGIKIKGAMGCAMAVALGYAMNTDKKVICLIGEGSFLMKLGTIATINKYRPKNLKVIILNNGKYESTGGQKNNSENIFSNELSHFDRRTYSVVKVS